MPGTFKYLDFQCIKYAQRMNNRIMLLTKLELLKLQQLVGHPDFNRKEISTLGRSSLHLRETWGVP